MIGGGEVRVMLIKLGPLRCPMPTIIENCGKRNNGRATKEVNDTIFSPYFILYVDMELL
jgi:hypothetical protein